ncbi:MAG: c-type cytochrome [Proteobacteria bacterium]|nr:c-type cytochrome [Pseudomonadota bacterium]
MRNAIVIAASLVLTVGATAARADEAADPIVTAHAERLAVGTCGTCHGVKGVSQQPKYPRLAGQNPSYLAAQLKAFRGQQRGDPDAIGYMWGMSASLEDGTIDALAAYYANQPAPAAGPSQDAAMVARGREIYEKGVESAGVPACSACHGPDAHGIADFPRLAGQHAQYVMKQLASFQNNMRNVAVMHGVAQALKVEEMRSVAAFMETLP